MLLSDDMCAIVDVHADKHGVPRPLARAVIALLQQEANAFVSDVGARVEQLHNLIELFGEDRAVAALRWDACFIASNAQWPAYVRAFVKRVNAAADLELEAMGRAS